MRLVQLDLFGTVFNLAGVPREEIVAYIDHISKPEWSPLSLPESWERLKPYPDACEGIHRLRRKFIVVTCSNAPLGFTTRLLKNAGIHFDAITPLEMVGAYKPSPECYLLPGHSQGVYWGDCHMVTGNIRLGRNPKGDHQYAAEQGINGHLIRHPGCPQTIIELAEKLGC